MKEKVLVSSCLIGEKCRYDGKDNKKDNVLKLTKYFDLIPICPEVNGGLKIPRTPSEIKDNKVISKTGQDVTEFYNNGAYLAETISRLYNIKLAILKEKSPSCGSKFIHDGNFNGNLIKGQGITTRRLEKLGVRVISEEEVDDLLKELESK